MSTSKNINKTNQRAQKQPQSSNLIQKQNPIKQPKIARSSNYEKK